MCEMERGLAVEDKRGLAGLMEIRVFKGLARGRRRVMGGWVVLRKGKEKKGRGEGGGAKMGKKRGGKKVITQLMETTRPSAGNDCVKKATSGGAPWKVIWAANWRASASNGAA